MIRAALTAIACMVASAAVAEKALTYGTAAACRDFQAAGSAEGLFGADTGEPWLLLTERSIAGVEWGCHIAATRSDTIDASCDAEGDEYEQSFKVVGDGPGLSLYVPMEDRSYALHPCR